MSMCSWMLLYLTLSSQMQFPFFLFSTNQGNVGFERGHFFFCEAQIIHDRMRPQDEPQLVSFRVLEGVTEPFLLNEDGVEMPGEQIILESTYITLHRFHLIISCSCSLEIDEDCGRREEEERFDSTGIA